jgi:hypothetical protein
VVEPPEDINIRLWPANMANEGGQPSQLDGEWKQMEDSGVAGSQALLKIGGGSPLLINGANLESGISDSLQEAEVAQVHRYIMDELQRREIDGGRKDQNPVVIHCFSGLPWKYALVVYDAVRQFEGTQTGEATGSDVEGIVNAREVNFAPPRIRNYHTWERGNEIFEIIHLK